RIEFVADPDHRDLRRKAQSSVCYQRPDDASDIGFGTWRETLTAYNEGKSNPLNLLQASDLYEHDVYRRLVTAFDPLDIFILSAGWGLIRSTFLTPYYNITFSNCKGKPWTKRKLNEPWQDFNHLRDTGVLADEEVHFFGGHDYLEFFYALTQPLPATKIIHYKMPERREGYTYEAYATPRNQNWHYAPVQDFIAQYKA